MNLYRILLCCILRRISLCEMKEIRFPPFHTHSLHFALHHPPIARGLGSGKPCLLHQLTTSDIMCTPLPKPLLGGLTLSPSTHYFVGFCFLLRIEDGEQSARFSRLP